MVEGSDHGSQNSGSKQPHWSCQSSDVQHFDKMVVSKPFPSSFECEKDRAQKVVTEVSSMDLKCISLYCSAEGWHPDVGSLESWSSSPWLSVCFWLLLNAPGELKSAMPCGYDRSVEYCRCPWCHGMMLVSCNCSFLSLIFLMFPVFVLSSPKIPFRLASPHSDHLTAGMMLFRLCVLATPYRTQHSRIASSN